MSGLQGHCVLVTGGTQGIGRAIALACAEAGADLVIHGLALDAQAEQTARDCRQFGQQVHLIAGDLSGPTTAAVEHVYRQAVTHAPNIDILINNAGGYFDKPFLQLDFATFEKTMRLNVFAYFFLAQAFARSWVDRQIPGRILMIGSINGRLAERTHAAYDTSKGAVEMMVKTLCAELAPYGIRVNGLAPGLIETPLTRPALQDRSTRRWMELHTPNGQVPGTEVVGDAAVFLVSDSARHIHGHMLLVDGGMSAWQQPDPPDPS